MQNSTVGARQVTDQLRSGIREAAPRVIGIVGTIRRLVARAGRPTVSSTRTIARDRQWARARPASAAWRPDADEIGRAHV